MSPRNREANEKLKEERKEQILTAALKVFARKNLQSTRIDDIAKEAGISHGALYKYFRSKEEIYNILLRRAFDFGNRFNESMLAGKSKGPLDEITRFIKGFLNELSKQDEFVYYFAIDLQVIYSNVMPEELKDIQIDNPPALDFLVRKVKEGQALGEIIDGDPVELGFMLFACITGIALSFIKKPLLPDVEHVLRIVKK